MVTKIQDGLVTYIGFHANKNKKFIVETKGNWTYINYQKDEFTRIICGYVVKQDDGRYRTHRLGTFDTNFKDRNVGYFDSLKDLGKEILDSSNTFVEVEEDLDEIEK